MKKYLLLIILALVSLASFGQSNEAPNDEKNVNITNTHLNLILSDLIAKKAFTKNSVLILNNYNVLGSCNIKNRSYNFKVVDKSALNTTNSNTILFWRMDVNDTKAHYEFYLNKTKDSSIKYDYRLQFKNGNWEILNQ